MNSNPREWLRFPSGDVERAITWYQTHFHTLPTHIRVATARHADVMAPHGVIVLPNGGTLANEVDLPLTTLAEPWQPRLGLENQDR